MLTMRQKKAVTKELKDRYQRSSKKDKTIMLNGFIQLSRYNRSYAARVLRIKEVLGYSKDYWSISYSLKARIGRKPYTRQSRSVFSKASKIASPARFIWFLTMAVNRLLFPI